MAKSERNLIFSFCIETIIWKVNAKLRSIFSAMIYWFSLLLLFLFTFGGHARWRTRLWTSITWENSRHFATQVCVGSASDWLKKISYAARPIKSTTQIWVVIHLQYRISALVPQTSFFGGGNNVDVTNVGCLLRLGHSVHKSKIHAAKVLWKKKKCFVEFAFVFCLFRIMPKLCSKRCK